MTDRVTSYTFRGNFTNLGAGLATMGKGVQDLGVKLTALDRQGSTSRRGLTTLGSTAGRAGLIAAAGVGAVVLAAANFDQAMSRVQAATGEGADGLDELRSAAIKAGADTVFSATEAADAITAMSKAGISAKDILDGGLNGALALASAGELDVAQAADIAATAMNQFGLAGEDIPHIADLLAAGAASAQGEVTDFATALKYVGPVAHQMGISIEETTGVIAELASQGVLADQAGTSLRGMLTALTSPSKLAATEMGKLGINLYDAQGQFVGFEGVAGQLQATLGGLTNAERDQALGRIFGNEQITAARILYAGGADAVEKWTTAVDKDGAAADIAATKLNNLKGDLEQLKGSLETAFIGSGEGSQGGLRTLVQNVTSAVNAFNSLPGPVKSSVTALGGITAVTGGSLWFGAKVIGGISNAKQALKDLGETGEKLKGVLKGVGTAAAGLAVLDVVGASVTALEEKFDRAVPKTEELTKAILDLGNANTAQSLGEDIGDLGDAVDRLNAGGITGATDKLAEMANEGGILGNALKGVNVLSGNMALSKSQKDLREYAASIEAVDGALANIALTGSPEQARAAFASLAAAQGLSKDQQAALLKLMPQYTEALDGAANQATLTGDATSGLTVDTTGLGTAADDAAKQVADLVKSMEDQKDAAVSAFDAITNYRQAMKDAAKQAEKNNAGIKGDSKAALENRNQLGNLISAWNSLDVTVTDNVGKFKQARDSFIKTATGMGVSKEAATKLWQEMAKIPSSKVIPVSTPGLDKANADMVALKKRIDAIKGKTVDVVVNTVRPHGGQVPTDDQVENPPKKHPKDPRLQPRLSSRGLNLRTPSLRELDGTKSALAAQTLGLVVKSSGDAADAFHEVGKGARGLKDQLHDAEQHLTRMSKSADDAHDALDQLKSDKDALSSSVSGSLEHDAFGGGLSEFQAQVSADTADAQAVLAALKVLVDNGLDPHSALFKRLAASGNVSLIQQFAALTRSQLAGEAASFAAGQGALTAVGQFAGGAAFNDLIKAQSKVTDRLDGTVHHLAQQVNQLEKAIKDMPGKIKQGAHDGAKSGSYEGSESGTRAGFDERRRRAHAGTRTGSR